MGGMSELDIEIQERGEKCDKCGGHDENLSAFNLCGYCQSVLDGN